LNITIKYPQTESGLVFNFRSCTLLSLLVSHLLVITYLIFSAFVTYACVYGYINSIAGTC